MAIKFGQKINLELLNFNGKNLVIFILFNEYIRCGSQDFNCGGQDFFF
jgi:hypothetical protein